MQYNGTSYAVVRVQKFQSGSVKGIEIHDRRKKDGISHTNKDIDWSVSDKNYDLHYPTNQNFAKAVKERISQLNLKKAVRKDAVVMAQVLVTSDNKFFKKLTEQEQKQFFKDSYAFLVERYGAENVISATVHLDETTPHLHFNFVPVTADGRLSAKSILTRQSITRQHTDFYRQVGKKYDLQRGELGSDGKHLETAELKLKTLQSEIENKEHDLKSLNAEIESKKEILYKSSEELYPPEVKLKGFVKKTVTMTKELWEQRNELIDSKIKMLDASIKLNDSVNALHQEPTVSKLKSEIDDLKQQSKELRISRNDYQRYYNASREREDKLELKLRGVSVAITKTLNNLERYYPNIKAEFSTVYDKILEKQLIESRAEIKYFDFDNDMEL